MQHRTLLGAAAFTLALAGGGVAGAVLGVPGVSGAQDGTTSTTTATAKDGTADADHPRPAFAGHPRFEVLKVAADELGMEPSALLEELRAGKSIADVAKEKGVDEQKVIDAIVDDGTAKLQEAIEEVPDRAKAAVERDGLPERPRGGPGGRPGDGPPPADGQAPADGQGEGSSTTSS